MEAKQWTVRIQLTEDGDDTTARAVLTTGDGADVAGSGRARHVSGSGRARHVSGSGRARRNPADPSMPGVGDELAVSRALADLSEKLAADARHDIPDSPVPPRSW
jgi:hypothetical protein